jgi:hypothetical protein
MTEVTAQQVDETLKLALQIVEARGDKPTDAKIWRYLLL